MGVFNVATELFLRYVISNPTFKDMDAVIRSRVLQTMSTRGLLNEIGSVRDTIFNPLAVTDCCTLCTGSSKQA